MHHISQQMISIEVRRPHINRFKRRLVRAIQTPGLDGETRQRLQTQITKLGEPKVYTKEGQAPAGAIDPGPMPGDPPFIDFDKATASSLTEHLHTHLVQHAINMELDVNTSDTKAQVINLILEHIQGGNP
jgi:hypothetical protein